MGTSAETCKTAKTPTKAPAKAKTPVNARNFCGNSVEKQRELGKRSAIVRAEKKEIQIIQDKVDNYFNNTERPNLCDLSIALGFNDDSELKTIAHSGDKHARLYSCAILRIKSFYENQLTKGGGGATGAIFALKNLGWKDTQEVHTENKNVELTVSASLQEIFNQIMEAKQ